MNSKNEIFEGLFDLINEGILIFSESENENILFFANKSAGVLLDIDFKDFIGKTVHSFKNTPYYDFLINLIKNAKESEFIQKDLTFQLKGLSYLYEFHIRKSILNEDILYYIWFSDVTVNRKIDEVKGNFFSIMSHELKTPLTIILGNLEIIKDEYPNIDFIDAVYDNSKKLEKIFDDLLTVSECYNGKLVINKSNVGLNSIIEESWEFVKSLYPQKKCVLRFEYDEEMTILADRERIKLVFTNILDNAVKFNRMSGEVTCIVRNKGEKVIVKIKDEGEGISRRNMNEVFDPFYQEEAANTRNFPGIGIGLTVAREIIRLHRGKIEIKNDEGKGTLVNIELPTGRKKEEVNILVVDDEEIIRKLFLRMLDNYNVYTAKDAFEALDKISEFDIDLVFMDIDLPGMNGIEATRRIKKAYPDISVCFVSAQNSIENVKSGMLAGGFDYIVKPFRVNDVLKIVKAFAK